MTNRRMRIYDTREFKLLADWSVRKEHLGLLEPHPTIMERDDSSLNKIILLMSWSLVVYFWRYLVLSDCRPRTCVFAGLTTTIYNVDHKHPTSYHQLD